MTVRNDYQSRPDVFVCVYVSQLMTLSYATVQTNQWDCPVQWADPRTAVAIEQQVLLSPRHCWLLNGDNEAWHIDPPYAGLEMREIS